MKKAMALMALMAMALMYEKGNGGLGSVAL